MSLSQRLSLQVDGRAVEAVLDRPEGASRGLAVIAHPHPLFGGTMDNKVVQTLARAHVQAGWDTLRFNFRGVGMSTGEHDHGLGEAQDLLSLMDQLAPLGPLALAGFSFGAYVAAPALPPEAHAQTLVIHGEQDDTVALAGVMDWARPQQLPVMVVPGGGHFFHGQLPLLKSLALRHLQA